MKTKSIMMAVCLMLTVVLIAQEQQEHIVESQSLVGIWRQTGVMKTNTGESIMIKSGNYKIVNSDGTFYTLITWPSNSPGSRANKTEVNVYGTYTITSDSTFTENIIKHSSSPVLNNSVSELRYKLVPESNNNLIYMMWKNTASDKWIPEMWERVRFEEASKPEITL